MLWWTNSSGLFTVLVFFLIAIGIICFWELLKYWFKTKILKKKENKNG